MSFFKLKNVTFQYPNGHVAVKDVSMDFAKGESVAIVGQNGAGKTTIAKMMNGLLKPTKGDVIIDEWNTKDYTTAQLAKKVGYVFQNPDDQIFHNTVYGEIEFGPKNLNFDNELIKKRVEYVVDLVGIGDCLKEHPYNLPYSMRKFVTIASVIAMDPSVIILDEPTAGQNPTSMKRLSKIIDSLTKQGKTIITITHDMEFVVDNFSRVIVMANKEKIADADKREVFWALDVLKRGMLKQPYISRLSRQLGLETNVLNIEEMIAELIAEKKRRKKDDKFAASV